MHILKVKSGTPLLPFLFESFPDVPKTRVKKWLGLQCVSVNDKTQTHNRFALRSGDTVKVEPNKKTPFAEKSALKILFHDKDILVIDKPEGLLTVATEKEKIKTAYFDLNEWLATANPGNPERVFIVHRLDRETSGLLVFAKNEVAKYKLQHEWEKVQKNYYAIVEGTPAKKVDTLRSHLAQNKTLRVYSTEPAKKDKEGKSYTKLAVTSYEVLKSDGKFSLLKVIPKTGRKNQIRVQLADIKHPIIGDKKYGSKLNPAGRLGLHAYEMTFKHPMTGEMVTFKSPLPRILENIVK